MKLWHISDTHGHHRRLEIPSGIDVVIHSGDATNYHDPYTNEHEARDFISWFGTLPIPIKIFVAGNHDTAIDAGLITKEYIEDHDIIYLENETIGVLVDGEVFKIFGSPHTPFFGSWAFMLPRNEMSKVWAQVDNDVDIIITHGPPKGVLDYTINFKREIEACGCLALTRKINEVKPSLVCFGHIHNNREIKNAGVLHRDGVTYSNASCTTDGMMHALSSSGNIIELNKKGDATIQKQEDGRGDSHLPHENVYEPQAND